MIPQYLLLRLLSNPLFSLMYKREVKLTLDRLPDGLSVELPILKQAKVVASVSYCEEKFYIFLDISDSPQKIQATYRNILIGKGWLQLPRNEEDNFPRFGFSRKRLLDRDFTESITFCRKKSNASLVLTTPLSENSITKATVKLELDPYYSPCQAEWERKAYFNNIPMPILIAPPQTEITKGMGAGGGGNSQCTTVIITTKLERKTLFDRYYSQMEEMGWENITAAETDLLSISLWEFKDSDNNKWRGLFNWTKIAKDSDKYLVYFEVIEQSFIDHGFTSYLEPILPNEQQISKELAERILENVLSNDRQKGQLLVGQLPSQLPLELPLPNNTEIVGSFNTEDYFRILLEVPQSPARIEQFYQQQLAAASWEKHEDDGDIFQTKGFVYSLYKPFENNLFCQKEQGWELSFSTHPSRSNYTDLRIQIKKSTPNSLCSLPFDKESQNNYKILLEQISAPILIAPETAEVLFLSPLGNRTSSSGDRDGNIISLNRYISSATIQTELSIEELTNHYFGQMSEYGWTQVSEIKQRSIVVGLWTLQNEQGNNFQATIELIKSQDFPQQYSANLTIIPTEDME